MAFWQEISIETQDKRLLSAFIGVGLVLLTLGLVFALIMLLVRIPALSILPADLYYQSLTGHGIFMFIFWLGFIQTAFLLVAGTVLIRRKLWSYKLAWAGFGMMTLAAALALAGVLSGANITYHGAVPLAKQYPTAWLIFLSFNVLAIGMLFVVADFILTILSTVDRKFHLESWAAFFRDVPIATFAATTGLFIAVPGLIAALKTFIPAFLWSVGIGSLDPGSYRISWHMAFHIYHYVPALALVGVAYVLVEAVADAQSVYSKMVAKALFLLYPFFVPPTFIYHLLVDPDIPQGIKFIGSVLSLLVGVPTVLHMFIITGMLEARMRGAGYSFLGWVRHLPWRNPAFGSLIMGLITLFFGGLLSYLLIQEQFSPILHNTFVVPAYIHPIAAGGANLIYMGALFYGMAVLSGRQLWGLSLARILPHLLGGAIIWMAAFGTAAGLAGVPRRYALLGADAPASWASLMNLSLGIGGMLAIVGGLSFVLIMIMTAMGGKKAGCVEESIKGMEALPLPFKLAYSRTPVALIPSSIFIVGIVIFTFVLFYLVQSAVLQSH